MAGLQLSVSLFGHCLAVVFGREAEVVDESEADPGDVVTGLVVDAGSPHPGLGFAPPGVEPCTWE